MLTKESQKHTKHAILTKPLGGDYHRHEWAVIGAPCSIIERLVQKLAIQLGKSHKVGYLDAAHKASEAAFPYHSIYTDNISYQSFSFRQAPGLKQHRKYFNNLNILLVNGNHFKADKQIVILNEKKKDSLKRKLDRLTDVRLVLVEKEGDQLYDFLHGVVKEDTAIYSIDDVNRIGDFITDDYNQSVAPVLGLVMAGGQSRRMGKDKGSIDYYGQPHREYLANLLSPFSDQVFMSLRQVQAEEVHSEYEHLYDSFTGLGPYGALLSAFKRHPNHAWLTIACDLPFLNHETLQYLVDNRNPSKLATCFHNPETGFPEPLITIWEPSIYPVLLEFLSQGYSCPRKVLINTEIEELTLEDTFRLDNANDPESFQEAQRKISHIG